MLTVVRDDGTTTSGGLGSGEFGPLHDLAHYVIESTLGFRGGFYGLLAQGWSIPDFEKLGTSARLADESIVAECMIGQFGLPGQHPANAAEFNELVRAAVAGVRPGARAPEVDDTTYAAMRQSYDKLIAQWTALPVGETLELDYPAA